MPDSGVRLDLSDITRDIFEGIDPFDYRYYHRNLARPYLSEAAFTRYKLRVEKALAEVLAQRRICGEDVRDAIEDACDKARPVEVQTEEDRIHHDIRALVNIVQARTPKVARPYVHMALTSFDVSDTANATRYRDALQEEIIPKLKELEEVLIGLAKRYSGTVQIGRTHGQHAVPITFGFAMAEYVSRLGQCVLAIDNASDLPGKVSGAVGAYNASSLFFTFPEQFEAEVLGVMGVSPLDISTQIVQSEPMIRLVNELELCAGVMANLARDMRNLQRTEIAEVGEEFEGEQVGSSTMPQKRNPINFENVESVYKIVMGLALTARLNQLSDHQRDLTNSASARMLSILLTAVYEMARRLLKIMAKLKVDEPNMRRNLRITKGGILAEPLYILLAAHGHPDAHEVVRKLTLTAQSSKRKLVDLFNEDASLEQYRVKFTPEQIRVLKSPNNYTGIAQRKANDVADYWEDRLKLKT